MEHSQRKRIGRAAATTVAVLLSLGLAGCGDADETVGPEENADVQDISENDGPAGRGTAGSEHEATYDKAFHDHADRYIGEKVTLSATVSDDITKRFFSIAGLKGTDVKPLLVMRPAGGPEVQDGEAIKVTGIVHRSLDPAALQKRLGAQLRGHILEKWSGEPYVEATWIRALNLSADE